MTFVTRGGKILIVNGALTNNPECCCECTCCDFDAATATIRAVLLEWSGPSGNSSGTLVSGSVVATAVTAGEDGCVGRFDFNMHYSDGCGASDTQPAYATLHQATGANGTCCFWKVYFSSPPNALCQDQVTNLNQGWPGPGPAIIPGCAGLAEDVPSGCPQQTTDPCYPYCSAGGFTFVRFTTNLTGDCSCPGDPTNSGGGSGGGGSDEGFP